MPAIPARIGFVLREQRIVEATSAVMKARYGDAARDPKDEPFETFFDLAADAQAMASERLALVGTERRRFQTEIAGAIDLDLSATTPTVTMIDDERQADQPALIVSVTEDAGSDRTILVTWG